MQYIIACNTTTEIMKIDKFDIKGLHGRFNFKAKLDRNVNILVGNNGSYKSLLLNILSILLQSVSLQEKYAVDEAVVTLAGPQGLIGYRRIKGTLADLEERAKDEHSVSRIVDKIKKDFGSETKMNITFGAEQYTYTLEGEKCVENDIKQKLCTDFISTFDVVDNGQDKHGTLLDAQLDKLQSNYSFYLSDLAKQMTDIIDQEGSITKNMLDQINGRKNLMLNFVNEAFSKTGKQLIPDQGRLTFRFENGKTISSEHLSAGEKQLMIILLTVLLQDGKECVVFLDEPEISLHVSWQYELINMLTALNPSAQFIITTHSPSIFADGWGDKIMYMEDITQSV